MAFQVSPGVLVQERDLTRIIPAVSTSIGAYGGEFRKGPLDEVVTISSEAELVDTFGKPDSNNFEHFFSAANFLQYSNSLRIVRATQTSHANANDSGSSLLIKNLDDYDNNYAGGEVFGGANYAARTAGAHGNNLLVSVCPSAVAFSQELASGNSVNGAGAVGDTTITVDDVDLADNVISVGDIIQFSRC